MGPKGGKYMMNQTDRYFIERKYHDLEQDFDPFSRMAYHGIDVLRNNWHGHELLRLQIRKSPHKYGSNDTETDLLAEAMAHYFSNKVNNVRSFPKMQVLHPVWIKMV